MASVQPGDEIIIQPGTYATNGKSQDPLSGLWALYLASANGTASKIPSQLEDQTAPTTLEPLM